MTGHRHVEDLGGTAVIIERTATELDHETVEPGSDVIDPVILIAELGSGQTVLALQLETFEVVPESFQKAGHVQNAPLIDQPADGRQRIHHCREPGRADLPAQDQGAFQSAHVDVPALLHTQVMQAGKQRCRHMGWAQGIRHILLDEDLLQNEGKLGEKGFLKGSVCTESTRIACLQPQPAASLHAAMPVVQHHLEHGRKVEPGRAGQISRPVDQTHLAVPGAAVVTRLLKAGPFPHEQIDDLDIVHEFRAAPLSDGGTSRLQQIFRRLFVDPQAEFGIIQRELAPGTQQQPGKLVGGITAVRQLAPDAGVFPVGIAFIDLDPGRRRLDTHELRHVQPQAV